VLPDHVAPEEDRGDLSVIKRPNNLDGCRVGKERARHGSHRSSAWITRFAHIPE
jgi:hypothetical protein